MDGYAALADGEPGEVRSSLRLRMMRRKCKAPGDPEGGVPKSIAPRFICDSVRYKIRERRCGSVPGAESTRVLTHPGPGGNDSRNWIAYTDLITIPHQLGLLGMCGKSWLAALVDTEWRQSPAERDHTAYVGRRKRGSAAVFVPWRRI